MPRIKIPIVSPPYPTLDGIELDRNSVSVHDGYIDEANDGYIDEANYLVKRPGLTLGVTLPETAAIDGLSYWQGEDLIIAVANQRCYSVDSVGTITDLSTPNGALLQFRNRPSFAYTVINGVDYLAVSNGGTIFISVDGGSLTAVSDGDAPTSSTHLVFINNRLVSNNSGTDVFRWSEFEDPFDWPTLGFATAEGEPDQITAIYKAYNELVLFGSNTTEFWYSTGDSTNPFARMQGTQTNQGTLSPSGIAFDGEDSVFYFIDSERNINTLVNRQVKNISQPIEALIQQLDTVEDATIDIVKFDSHKFVLCSFPTDDVTYVYDATTGYWCQWGKYDSVTSSYKAFLGKSHAWANQRGINYVGSNDIDGRIFILDRSSYTDNGDDIRVGTLTGWIDTGTSQSKRWRNLSMRIKRQPGTGFTYQVISRKDKVGSTDVERVIEMDNAASKNLVQRLRNFGTARAIQFEIYHTEDSPFIIGNFELEYIQNRI